MKREQFTVGTRACTAFTDPNAKVLLLQPSDTQDFQAANAQAAFLAQNTATPFTLVLFEIMDWNRELTAWDAPPAFGKQSFGHDAPQTLSYLRSTLLPALFARYGLSESTPLVLGGYSLAALFALWCAAQTDVFAAVSASSPSVWYPGWIDFAAKNPLQTGAVYLSLGTHEERTKNPVMASVGERIRTQLALLQSAGTPCTLQWNEGGHFKDAALRCAKGFAWCIDILFQ